MVYSILKESKYTSVFLSINNETEHVSLRFLSWRFFTFAPSLILGKLFLEKDYLIEAPNFEIY